MSDAVHLRRRDLLLIESARTRVLLVAAARFVASLIERRPALLEAT